MEKEYSNENFYDEAFRQEQHESVNAEQGRQDEQNNNR
jgi:hypothetical protein